MGDIESQFLSLFTVRKEGKYRTTDCSNFRLRFLKKDQIFSAFFEPPSDYHTGIYRITTVPTNQGGKRLYKSAVQQSRFDNLPSDDGNKLILEQHFANAEAVDKMVIQEVQLETLLTIWLTYEITETEHKSEILKAREEFYGLHVFEKEGLAQYLEKGFLFSSQFIIRFYALYRQIINQGDLRGEDLYREFCLRVRVMMDASGISRLITKPF
ncbi:MAG: hypothetical protein IPP15_16210 [Saprospiraceae bacterium]|uniref:Uncharacterized protein n=1 Tax=Candidatus Opimibacter skivensis TaxID=2982028 RepID=A0A9D7SXS1_9BACT|nr:hypothetical protein [Candidatus Opimibacter skivensis]